MKIDDAITRIEKIILDTNYLGSFATAENKGTSRAAVRAVLGELHLSGMEQGKLQLQEDLRHLLGVVKE